MKYPGRSTLCDHMQCFDIEQYLFSNLYNPNWTCPICEKHIPYETLYIDMFYYGCIVTAKKNKVSEFRLYNDTNDNLMLEIE